MKTEFKTIIILFCNNLREILSEESLQKTREFLNSSESLIFQSSRAYEDFKKAFLSDVNFSILKSHHSEELRFSLVVQVIPQLMHLWRVSELDKVGQFFHLHKMNQNILLKESANFEKLEQKALECIKTNAFTFDEYKMYEATKSVYLSDEFLALCASEKLNKARVGELIEVLDDVLSLLPDNILAEAERNLDVKHMTERRKVIDSYCYSPSEIDIEEEKRRLSVEFYGNLITRVKEYRRILKDDEKE